MTDETRPVRDFPGYFVSSSGDVLSSWAVGRRAHPHGTHMRRLVAGVLGGYRVVTLCRDGRHITRPVHHLVLEAFVGPRPDGTETRHLNDQKLDNRPDNLRWGTRPENIADRLANGRGSRGQRNGQARLNDVMVRAVRWLVRGGMRQRKLSRVLGISNQQVSSVVNRHAWAWLA